MTGKQKKLSDLSDEELIQKIRGHQREEEAMTVLLERYKNLVRSLARPYYLLGGDREDLIQEGMIGLYQSIESYQEGIGTFRGYASMCIKRCLQSAIRSDSRQKQQILNHAVSLDEPVSVDEDGTQILLMDQLADEEKPTPEEELVSAEEKQRQEEMAKSVLSPLENRVFELFAKGYDYQEIASELHISPKSADNALQRAKRKLSLALKESGGDPS